MKITPPPKLQLVKQEEATHEALIALEEEPPKPNIEGFLPPQKQYSREQSQCLILAITNI